jgi:hypothetical protein
MSAFYSSQAYANFLNEITQQASQKDNEEEQYENEEAQSKETSTMVGTEILAQSAPMLVHTVARVGSRIKSFVEAGSKVKNAVEKGIATVKAIPEKVEQLGTKLKDIGNKALDEGKAIAERTGAKISEVGSNALGEGRAIADRTVSRGSEIVGDVARFKNMSQEKLNKISDDVKANIDGKVATLRAKGQELTPQLKAKYDNLTSLAEDKTPEGIAKLQTAYKDIRADSVALKKQVSSTGKEAVSKLNPREQLAKMQSSLEEQKSKVANFVKEKDSTISTLTSIHNDKVQELAQRKATIQRKLQGAETKQEHFNTPKEARYVAPEESVYRTGGSLRVPQTLDNSEDLSGTIASYKRSMSNIDSRITDLGTEHINALQRVADAHTKNITAPLAKIDEVSSTLESAGKSALSQGRAVAGAVMEHIVPALDVGFAGASLNNLVHGGDKGNIGNELNDVNMVRHGATSGYQAGKAVVNKVVGQSSTVADDALQAGKGLLQKTAGATIDATSEGVQAGKTLAINTAKETGTAVADTVGEVLGPVGEIADVALMAYSLFTGISDIKTTPYIAPPPPQQINIVHQAGIS